MIYQWYSDDEALIFEPGFTIVVKGHIFKMDGVWIVGVSPFMNNSGAIIFQKKHKFNDKEEAMEWFQDNVT